MKETFEYIIEVIFVLLLGLSAVVSAFLFAFGPIILIAHNDDEEDKKENEDVH